MQPVVLRAKVNLLDVLLVGCLTKSRIAERASPSDPANWSSLPAKQTSCQSFCAEPTLLLSLHSLVNTALMAESGSWWHTPLIDVKSAAHSVTYQKKEHLITTSLSCVYSSVWLQKLYRTSSKTDDSTTSRTSLGRSSSMSPKQHASGSKYRKTYVCTLWTRLSCVGMTLSKLNFRHR